MVAAPSSANPSVPHPAKFLFATITDADWAKFFKRAPWVRNEKQIRIREVLTPGKIYLLRKDGL